MVVNFVLEGCTNHTDIVLCYISCLSEQHSKTNYTVYICVRHFLYRKRAKFKGIESIHGHFKWLFYVIIKNLSNHIFKVTVEDHTFWTLERYIAYSSFNYCSRSSFGETKLAWLNWALSQHSSAAGHYMSSFCSIPSFKAIHYCQDSCDWFQVEL